MTEKEIKAKLDQVFDGLVMNQYQRDTLKEIILQAVNSSESEDTKMAKASLIVENNQMTNINQLSTDADIADVISTINTLIYELKRIKLMK